MDFTIHHAAISAIDMAESVAFYEQFGFRVVLHWKDPDGELEIAHLKLGANYSINEAKGFVENRGIASNIEVQQRRTGVTYFFIKDPSGILVEFLEDKRGF